MENNKDEFNIIIVGTGGQGLITLLGIIAKASLIENYDIRTSELHGLSQRGGSVEVQARLGKKIFSPLVSQGGADLILGLELQECLKACYYASPKTNFLINKYVVPIPLKKSIPEDEILKNLKKFTKKINLIDASRICQKELGTTIVAGIYLLSMASFKNLIPIKPKSILKAIKKVIPEKYLELNIKAFNLASDSKAVK